MDVLREAQEFTPTCDTHGSDWGGEEELSGTTHCLVHVLQGREGRVGQGGVWGGQEVAQIVQVCENNGVGGKGVRGER